MGECILVSHGSGMSGVRIIPILQVDYDSLSDLEKNNVRKAYLILDSNALIGDQVVIDKVNDNGDALLKLLSETESGTTVFSGNTVTKTLEDGKVIQTVINGSVVTETIKDISNVTLCEKVTTINSDGSISEVFSIK